MPTANAEGRRPVWKLRRGLPDGCRRKSVTYSSVFAVGMPRGPSRKKTALGWRDGDDYVINGHKWYISGAIRPECKVCLDMCMDVCMDMGMDICMDMCVDMRMDMCTNMCMDMCVDMYVDMYVDVYMDMCIFRHVYRHVYGRCESLRMSMCVDTCFDTSSAERHMAFRTRMQMCA